MTDVNTANLCEQIIRTEFGPLVGEVASVLLRRGRLPLPQILRFTGLKPRTVRAAILVLVQHNILWHAQSPDDSAEVFEVNTEECIMRLRYGRYVWQAEWLFGKAAAEVVQLVLDNGKMRLQEIIEQLSLYDSVKGPTLYAHATHELVEAAYLKPSTILSHISPQDKRIKYEAQEKAKISGYPSAKDLRQARETAGARLKREEEDAEKVGMKRKAKDHGSHRSNKARLSSCRRTYKAAKHSQRKLTEQDVVDEGVYFRVNCEKFNIHIRNKILEDAARERFNDYAALVMRASLKATEAKQVKLSDVRSDATSLASMAAYIPEDEDLAAGLALSSQRKPSHMVLLKDYCGILASADNPTPAGRAASFISLTGSRVQVEFEIISSRLRRRILEAVTRDKHGDDGVRIVRLLLQMGKMDEKQISKVGMMAPKDVRPLLSAMAADSIISLQEVPKGADRNPARTFFLWHVDLQKAYAVLLGNLYKTLYNISIRRQAESEEPLVKAVLEKRERSDVSQDEERLLTRNERETLAEWEKKREKLTVLEMRVEECVFIIRDLGTFGVDAE